MSLREPLLNRRAANGRSDGGKAKEPEESGLVAKEGFLDVGSPASSVLLLSSAAIGTGVLALPYGVSRVGVLPALLLFALAGFAGHVSNVILFACVRETRLGSYGELMTGILGKNGAMVLDGFVWIEGLGAVATYLVFIMDYVPQVCAIGGEDMWCTDPIKVVLVAACIIWPLSCLRGLSALRYTSTCSIVTIIFTSIVVIVKAPVKFANTGRNFSEAIKEAHLGVGAFQVLSMACFAFMTHTNTPEIALRMIRPTRLRTRKVVGTFTVLLCVIYSTIAVCGFLSFMDATQQDFLINYEIHDTLIIVCRCMLSTTLILACPLNIFPAIQALCNILQALRPANGEAHPHLYDDAKARVLITTACFLVSFFVALRSPHVADLISVICAFFMSPLMFTFPAMMYRSILKRQDWLVPATLHVFTASLCFAEVYRLLH